MPSSEDRPRLVCRCLGVASPRIFAAVRADGLRSVDEVTKAVRAGGGCGTCHPEIEEILADVAGQPVDSAMRLENRLVNEAETRARIDGTVDHRVRPALRARGVEVVTCTVSGLRVHMELSADPDETTRSFVAAELHRLVCRDLDVVVEGGSAPR